MTEAEKFFMSKFSRVCVNSYQAIKKCEGIIKRQWYRHPDLDNMSKEAFEAGEDYFYCKPVNPYYPNGKQVKCEPEYRYMCGINLSEEEYEKLKNMCEARKERT